MQLDGVIAVGVELHTVRFDYGTATY
jgi:hypothetical protein